MQRKMGPGFWVFLLLTTIVHSKQAGSVSPTQAPQDDKPKDEKSVPAKPAATVKVSGKIVDRDRKPLASSEVVIAGPKGETKTTTDSAGAFAFEGAPGKYTITVKAVGKSQTFPYEIGTGKLDPLILIFK